MKVKKKTIFFSGLFILILLVVLVSAQQERREFYVTGDTGFSTVPSNTMAQTFEVGTDSSTSFVLDKISFNAIRLSGAGTTISINVTSSLPSGEPDTTAVHSQATFDISGLSNTGNEWFNVTMPSVVLNLSTNYSIILSKGDGGLIRWHRGTDGIYPGSRWVSADEGASWGENVNQDGLFEVYGSDPGEDIVVELVTPLDGSSTTESILQFNATFTPVNANLTNATLFLFNETDILNNSVTNLISGEAFNSTNWTIANIPIGNLKWNVFACGTNTSSDILCRFAVNNFTFIRSPFTIDGEGFTGNVFETDSNRFEINITTIESILSVTANLVYNNTDTFQGTVNCDGGVCNIFRNADIPLVTSGGSQNKSFFWEINVFDGTNTISSNSTANEQNVSRVFFESCGSTVDTLSLNFTAFDEQTSERISPFFIAGEFDFWLGGGGKKRQFSFSNQTSIDEEICIFPQDRNFTIDDTIEYNDVINSSVYNTRNYYFQNSIVNNLTQHIPLFLLGVDDSTTFILKVQDTNLLPIPNALINIQRFNVGTGNFTTVQIARTDDNGQTVGFFKTETVDYRFIITKNGKTLLTTGIQKVVPESAPFTLIFTVGEDEGAPWLRFEDLPDLTKTLVFNRSTSIVAFTYVDSSGSFSNARLLVRLQNLSGVGTTICDVNSSLTSAILNCDTGNVTGTYTASGFITRGSDIFLVEQITFSIQSFSSTAGLLGVLLAWFIVLISAFAFKFNEIAGIVLMNLAVIMVNLIGLVNFGYLFVFGMMGVSIIIIVLLEK